MVASVMVRNFTSSEKEAKIIVAGYNGGSMVDVKVETLKVPAKTLQLTTFTTTEFTPKAPIDQVKAYVWSDMTEIVPLIEAVVK